jgi:hypothetical protein
MSYQPELGQMIFGQPHQNHEVSNLVDAALCRIRDELDRVMWNVNQEQYSSPFGNTGNAFKCETFEVHAYSWGDDEQPFNFKWRDVEISWYKYLGRGMSSNMEIPPALVSEMLDDCLRAAAAWEHSDEAKEIVAVRRAQFEQRHAGLQS